MRTCVGCRRRRPPDELVRVHPGPGARLLVGPGPGRGAWLCADSAPCLELALARRSLERALRLPALSDETVTALRSALVRPVEHKGATPRVCEDGGPQTAGGASAEQGI